MTDNQMDRRDPNPEIVDMQHRLTYLADKVEDLDSSLTSHIEEEAETFNKMIAAVTDNTESIAALTRETRTIVELHRDAVGVVKFGKGLQSFLLWVIKWGAIIGTLGFAMKWLKDHL